MKPCSDIERLVEGWENEGSLPAGDRFDLHEHCAECVACARRYASLLPLVDRDAGGAPVQAPEIAIPAFADRVMERIGGLRPRRVLPVSTWAAVAAACLILVAGVGAALLRASPGRPTDEVVVRFVLVAPGAQSVAVAGTFTNWSASKLFMTEPKHDGVWQVDVRLKRDSVNTYNFVIDGTRWIPDPRSPTQVDDGFGGLSSVLRL